MIKLFSSNPNQNKSLYSIAETFKLEVDHGKTYLLRLINAAVMDTLFFSIAKHKLTVVATDASYTKPLTVNYLTISPGQTLMSC